MTIPFLLFLLPTLFHMSLAEADISHAKSITNTDKTELGIMWKLLCGQILKMPASLESSVKGTDKINSIPKATNTARSKDPHPLHKELKEKKKGVKNEVPSHAIKVPHGNRISFKENKAPINLKILGVNSVDPSNKNEGTKSSSRRHKASFVNYPATQRIHKEKDRKLVGSTSRKKQKQKLQKGSSKHKQKQESDIYFIRLPPTPYSYVPGLGYISRPPSFSTSSLGQREQNPFIKLPIDFVSNGKPTAVYRWTPPPSAKDQHHHYPYKHQHHQQEKNKPGSPIIRLNRGPYVFDGRPTSIYLMEKSSSPPSHNLY